MTTPKINDRVQTKARSAETGTIKDIREREGLSPVYIILWDNPGADGGDNTGQLLDNEFDVITPLDVANSLIAMSNDNFATADVRAGLYPAMRHILYWGDSDLLLVLMRLMYDLGRAAGHREIRDRAESENRRMLDQVKSWLQCTQPIEERTA